jgi:undecaprenyl-diphosphatase
VALGIAVAGTSSASFVDDVLLAAAGGPSPTLWTKALPIDFLGEPLGVVLMTTSVVAICLVLRRWRLAVLTPMAQGAIWGCVILVKPVFDRTIHGEHLAYPSGHTAGTAAFALVTGLLLAGVLRLRRAAALAVILGAAVAGGSVAAWAQTVLVAHYATDTLGGLCLTLAVVPPLALLVDHVSDRLLVRLPATSLDAPASAPGSVGGAAASPLATPEPGVTRRPTGTTYGACNQAVEGEGR